MVYDGALAVVVVFVPGGSVGGGCALAGIGWIRFCLAGGGVVVVVTAVLLASV